MRFIRVIGSQIEAQHSTWVNSGIDLDIVVHGSLQQILNLDLKM